jgi:hypothetical protein
MQSTTHVPQASRHFIVEIKHIGTLALHAHDFTFHTRITRFKVIWRIRIRDKSFSIHGFLGTYIC